MQARVFREEIVNFVSKKLSALMHFDKYHDVEHITNVVGGEMSFEFLELSLKVSNVRDGPIFVIGQFKQ